MTLTLIKYVMKLNVKVSSLNYANIIGVLKIPYIEYIIRCGTQSLTFYHRTCLLCFRCDTHELLLHYPDKYKTSTQSKHEKQV